MNKQDKGSDDNQGNTTPDAGEGAQDLDAGNKEEVFATGQSPEATGSVEDALQQTEDVEALREALRNAETKADDLWEQLLRAKADLTNQQRRAERELENAHKFAIDNFMRELLPIHDSLELGVQAAKSPEAEPLKLAEGSELTLDLFNKVLGKFGASLIDPEGEPFNPEHHQAMSMLPSADVPPNTVIKVFQKGCLLNDRLVRPATVIVSKPDDSKGDKTAPRIDEMA